MELLRSHSDGLDPVWLTSAPVVTTGLPAPKIPLTAFAVNDCLQQEKRRM
jgi:hypothetical protein